MKNTTISNEVMEARSNIIERIEIYLSNNKETAQEVIAELNGWNGALEHLDVYENDDYFFELFFSDNPAGAVRAAQYGDYRYNDAYVRFNGYGSLESLTVSEYEDEIDVYISDITSELLNNYYRIHISDSELMEMIEEFESIEDAE